MKKRIFVVVAALVFSGLATHAAKPLKVFILAGQSNMEGHAKVETFDYIGDTLDPSSCSISAVCRC